GRERRVPCGCSRSSDDLTPISREQLRAWRRLLHTRPCGGDPSGSPERAHRYDGLVLLRSSLAVVCLAALAGGQPERVPDAFFVPSSQAAADAMLELAGVTAGDVVYDLGSGDGRIPVVAAQKYGARGVGIEIDPALVARARAIAREG